MKILNKEISELKENDYNPNEIPEHLFKSLVENIKKFGFLQPILIDTKNTIIDGAHRFKAAKECGLKKIQCVIYEGNNDIKEYRKLLTLSMNNIRGINNQENFEKVIKELAYDIDYEELEKYTGFDVNLITDIVNNKDFIQDDKINEKEMDILDTEHQCPKCGYEW